MKVFPGIPLFQAVFTVRTCDFLGLGYVSWSGGILEEVGAGLIMIGGEEWFL